MPNTRIRYAIAETMGIIAVVNVACFIAALQTCSWSTRKIECSPHQPKAGGEISRGGAGLYLDDMGVRNPMPRLNSANVQPK
jgi:hypothetical protein